MPSYTAVPLVGYYS